MLGNNKNSFNHLKIHTQYSICEGALKIEDLKSHCKKNFKKLRLIESFKPLSIRTIWRRTPKSCNFKSSN